VFFSKKIGGEAQDQPPIPGKRPERRRNELALPLLPDPPEHGQHLPIPLAGRIEFPRLLEDPPRIVPGRRKQAGRRLLRDLVTLFPLTLVPDGEPLCSEEGG